MLITRSPLPGFKAANEGTPRCPWREAGADASGARDGEAGVAGAAPGLAAGSSVHLPSFFLTASPGFTGARGVPAEPWGGPCPGSNGQWHRSIFLAT